MVYAAVTHSFRLIAFPFDAGSGKSGPAQPLFGGSQEIGEFAPSPDRQLIAFTTSGGAQEDLFVATADGTHVRQLTNDAAKDRGPAWSPDGKTIYLYSNRDGAYHIWSIHADGSGLTRVTDDDDLRRHDTRGIYAPDVSPDGRTLAARIDHSAVLVHLDQPAGHRLETIADLGLPKWSPDGKQLAGEVKLSVGVYSLQTRRLEIVFGSHASPQWLPDGRHLALLAPQSITLLDLDSRQSVTDAFKPPGVDFGTARAVPQRLSTDGSVLYAVESLEQGDIWMVRFETP
jgi:Tol biopolymer transport system component